MEKTVTSKKSRFTRADVFDVISMLLIGISILFSVYRFFSVAQRIAQSVRDLGVSIAFYFTELYGFEGVVQPTVGIIPDQIGATLPGEWDEFKLQLETYGELLIDKDNIKATFNDLLAGFASFSQVLVLLLPIVALGIFLLVQFYKIPNNEYTKKTKPREVFEKLEQKTYQRAKAYIKDYFRHLKQSKPARIALIIIWLYNFNVITIAIELFAYAFCFAIEFFNSNTFYAQLVKLIMDLRMPFGFFPWWLEAYLGWKVFDLIRRKIGLARLRHYEKCDRDFLETYPGALFLVGKQRAKKTTIITDMALTQEIIFRDEAKERLATRDKQFPHFPWQNVEQFYRITQKNHSLPTLASCRDFIGRLRRWFEKSQIAGTNEEKKLLRQVRRHYARRYGYKQKDLIFEYDYEKYGLTYDDGCKIINVFEAIEAYLQLFYIYAAKTTLLFGNYSIRTDLQWDDEGNFPLPDGDFFTRKSSEVEQISQYSHVAKLDCFRLGKVFDPADPFNNAFEVGILNMMENAKERGNQITNAADKADDANVNAKNDQFELNIKMQGHASTIDNYTFFRFFMDDQRPDSLSADNKDLCDVILIKNVNDAKIVMLGFLFEELLYKFATKIHDKIYYRLRNVRGDANNTLLVYLMKKLYNPIFKHYDRVYKQYSVYVANLKIWDAMQDEVLTDKGKYFISTKKTYSDRFATDGIKQFYHKKALDSKYGLNDFPTFTGKHITVEQMEASGSLFYRKIIDAFYKKKLQGEQIKALKNRKAS